MLRWAVLVLALANAGVLAWNQGWLDGVAGVAGVAAESPRDPGRLQRQVEPGLLRVVRPSASSPLRRVVALAPATVCVEAGPLRDDELEPVEAALRDAGVPEAGWQRAAIERPGSYIVYMGRYADPEVLQRRRAELQRRNVAFEPVRGRPDLEPGLQLGRFEDSEVAARARDALADRGVRGARIVTLASPQRLQSLRVEHVEETTAASLLKGEADRAFRPCAAAPAR